MARLILVRHPPVAKAWAGRCYGQSDMGLSREGQTMLAPLAVRLAALEPDMILHSGMRRTRVLADMLGRCTVGVVMEDCQWRERDFGNWEGRTWNSIYRETGDAMDGMIEAPGSFRPGDNGETTYEMVERVRGALAALSRQGCIAIIAHGGPIAAARYLVEGTPITDLARGIIPPATFVELAI
jgi:broad specificity phosphatase PhoE